MKIERQLKIPTLGKWGLSYPMQNLRVKHVSQGYGGDLYYVYAVSDMPWFGHGNPIAELGDNEIRLFETSYFSDMERFGKAYESETGYEVTLKYWQSPKDQLLKSA